MCGTLWTTKEGFESWWGPQGFRADVHELDARVGGALRYDMVADTPEMIAAMKKMGRPLASTRSRFTELEPIPAARAYERHRLPPGRRAYESDIAVDFSSAGGSRPHGRHARRHAQRRVH